MYTWFNENKRITCINQGVSVREDFELYTLVSKNSLRNMYSMGRLNFDLLVEFFVFLNPNFFFL